MAGGCDALGILIRAGGAGIGANAGRGTGSGGGHLGAVAVTGGRNGDIPVVSTVISNTPGIATRTGCSTGGGLGYLIGMVSRSQLADGDVAGGAGTTGTSTQQRTGGTGGGILGYLISIVVAQSAAGGAATVGALLRRSTSCGCIVMAGSGNGTGEAESTIGGGFPRPGIGTCGCTGSRLGGGSRIVRSGQFRHRHRGGSLTTGAGTLNRTRRRSGGVHILGIAVAVAQGGAGSRTAGTGRCLGTSRRRIAVGNLVDAGGKGKRTVSGRIPLPGVSTCGRTGSRRFHRSGVIAGCQFRHRHRGGSLTTGAGTRQRTGSTGGGVLCGLVAVAVTQGRAGSRTTYGTLLSHGTGSRGVVMVRGLGNGLGLGTGAVVTGVSLNTSLGTGGCSGHGAAVPAVGAGTPSTVFAVPPTGLHGVHTAGVSRNSQVRGLVPLISPVIGSISAVHSAENNVAITRRDITNIDIVALGGHTDPFVGRFILEKIRSKTGTVGRPFAVDLQNQLGGGSRLCFCRSHHAEDDTNRADQQQDTKKLDHFPLHRVPPVF